MKEIEVKILEIDPVEIQKKLESFGAQKTFSGEIEWSMFDFADGSLSKKEIFLRVRKMGKKTIVTSKVLIARRMAKISEESEVEVGDFDRTVKILQAIGLSPKKGYPMKKIRTSYALDKLHFEIDTLPGLPTFLEIEAPSEALLEQYITKLGFSVENAKPWGARELYAYYKK